MSEDHTSNAPIPDTETDHQSLPARRTAFRGRGNPGVAGGVKAVAKAMQISAAEMGLVRGARALLAVNQKDGFDCPGCAWPDPAHRAMVEFCENGAKAVAEEATTKRVTRVFFARWSLDELGTWSEYELGKQGRLTEPMVRRAGARHYTPIAWDDAFDLIAEHLNALDSPDEAIFYTSGRTSNEAAFLYQLFVRQLGTNNLPDCSNMCHESSGTGLGESIGVGKGTVSLADFDQAEAIFIIGQNPGTNHPRMLTVLERARRRGATIVSINPLREAGLVRFKHPQDVRDMLGGGTRLAELFVPVRINGDVALLKAVCKVVLEHEAERPGQILDHAFIEAHTEGFEAWREALATEDLNALAVESGVDEAMIRQLARIVVEARSLICCWAMGLTQHKNGVANVQEVVNLLLLRGNMGRPGAGACPVRGHSNVQGDRTMGIWERPPAAFLDKLGQVFDFEPPREHGLDVVESIEAMASRRAHVFFAMGGNFLSAAPDTNFTAGALTNTRLTVHVSTKLNRSHVVTGAQALILPCLGRTERDLQASGEQLVTVENSMSVVHASRGRLPPASPHLLSEPAIVARLAIATLGQRSSVDWASLTDDYDRIRDLIARVVPGFEDYNTRVRQPDGFVVPNGARERRFDTEVGKARFTIHPLPHIPLAADQYLMMTVRTHDQYNTTIYGLDDRYRGIYKHRRVVLMNADDLAAAGLREGDEIELRSHFEGEVRSAYGFVVVPWELPTRCIATYFPEANVLVPARSFADKSHTPASKSVVVSIHR